MQWLHDTSDAEWIAPTLNPRFTDLGMILPPIYAAYARIFHPIDEVGRWAELAASNGRIAHADMQFHLIETPRGQAPAEIYSYRNMNSVSTGSLPRRERGVVVEHLRDFTPTDDVLIGLWHGYGDFAGSDLPTFEHPAREYFLGRGVLDDVLTGERSPNLWWPVDRRWFVATEVDYVYTYVGGSTELIDSLVDDDRLEAWPVDISHRPFADADTVNEALNR